MVGHRDLGISSYERSWLVDVPFDSFGQIRPPGMAEIVQNALKTAVFRNMGIYEIVNTPWNRGAVGAFSCFTNTSLFNACLLLLVFVFCIILLKVKTLI